MPFASFATFAPETTGRIGSFTQKLMKSNGAGGWIEEAVPFNALYDAVGQLTSFQAVGTSPVFQWGHTYSYGPNSNRKGGTITQNGSSLSVTNGMKGHDLLSETTHNHSTSAVWAFAVGYTFAGCRAAVFGACKAGCRDEPPCCPAEAP